MGADNCWNCRTYQQRFRCRGCGYALYCSKVCQKEHWKYLHGSHCKYLIAKKKLAGAEHPSPSCVSCKKQSVDYKNLQKQDSSGMGCCLKEFDNDLRIFKNYFDKLLMFNMDVRRSMETQTITRSNYNLPFEFGEITGKYIDYFDKLLAYLQSLACHLLHRYPQTKELKEVSFMLLNYRAIHWAASCQTKDFEGRVAITLKYVANTYWNALRLALFMGYE